MAKKDVPGGPKNQGLGSLARKVIKHPVLRIGSSLYDAYTALPQEIKDKVRDSILPPPDQETVGPSSFPPIEIEHDEYLKLLESAPTEVEADTEYEKYLKLLEKDPSEIMDQEVWEATFESFRKALDVAHFPSEGTSLNIPPSQDRVDLYNALKLQQPSPTEATLQTGSLSWYNDPEEGYNLLAPPMSFEKFLGWKYPGVELVDLMVGDKFKEDSGVVDEGPGIASLPMDEASRMKRAQDMGFGEVLYHATKQDIHEFIPGYDDGLTFVTPNPEMANEWLGKGKYRVRLGAEDEIESIREAQRETRRNTGDWEGMRELTGDEHSAAFDAARKAYKRAEPVSAEDVYSAIYPVRSNVKNTFDPRKDYPVIEDFLRKRYKIKQGDTSFIEQGLHKEGNWLIYENKEVVEELKRLGSSTSAEYNPEQSESPDITKAHGGFVDKPLYDRDRSYYG